MKKNLNEEVKDLFIQAKDWLKMEIEYAKLTAAEKFSVLLSTLILIIVMFIVSLVVLIVFAFALIDLFSLMMPHALACVTVGGIYILLIGCLYLLRKQLIINPIARLISKLFLSPKQKSQN